MQNNGHNCVQGLINIDNKEYKVREIDGKFYPEYYDEDLGWIGYSDHTGFMGFDYNGSAWGHINTNPDQYNMGCD